MTLTDSLRAIALAAVSEPGRNERELQRQSYEDRDELAARRKQHAYLTKREADEARAEDEHERDLRGF